MYAREAIIFREIKTLANCRRPILDAYIFAFIFLVSLVKMSDLQFTTKCSISKESEGFHEQLSRLVQLCKILRSPEWTNLLRRMLVWARILRWFTWLARLIGFRIENGNRNGSDLCSQVVHLPWNHIASNGVFCRIHLSLALLLENDFYFEHIKERQGS